MLSKIIVLVVDDSPEDRQIYQRYLQRDKSLTYDLHAVDYASEGLDFCRTQWPDLIVLDFLLPDLNGIQFIDALAKIANDRRLPAVLVLTGQGNEEIAVLLMKKGVEDYLLKNKLTERDFQVAVHKIISQIELRESLAIQQEWQRVVSEVALRVRKSLVIKDMLDTAVGEIKRFLNCDRSIVYQFGTDWMGDVVAEAVDPQWRAALGAQIFDTCFQETKGLQYQHSRHRIVPDVAKAGLSECYSRLLADFQVKAVLVVPILLTAEQPTDLPRLWGLLICHQCQIPREWTESAILFLDQLAVQMGIAIYQAELVQKLNQELTQRTQVEQNLRDRTKQQEWLIKRLGKATSQLEQRNQDLDSFVAIASHDLRAPLRAIGNLATWLAEDLADTIPSGSQQQFSLLILRVRQMEALLNDLLEYARVGRMSDRQTTVCVGDLLTQIVDDLDVPTEFTISIDPNLPTLSTNRIALEQIFTNLIGNAIVHHPRENGKVAITATQTGDVYQFAVTDDGAGIDPKHHQAIFEIFTTFNQSATSTSTGVGLAIVKKLVELQGGTISIESEFGLGTTFRFTWPINTEQMDDNSLMFDEDSFVK
ncbi:MAG: hypothetical protein RLZZ135_1698 [Cyanobacteriota bacterium]|jgi:light-regulated signal transduction histidine kinase (bacteriophytochrome)